MKGGADFGLRSRPQGADKTAIPLVPPGEDVDREFPRLLGVCLAKDRQSHMGRLTKGLIHNINGPLQNMSMLTEMLIREHEQLGELATEAKIGPVGHWERSYAKQQQRLNWLMQQISALGEILRDFMVFQEIECNESEIDLHLLLSKLVKVFNADLFCKHHVALDLNLKDSVPLVRILGRDLVPALIHLLRNALNAVREAPVKKISITCEKNADRILLTFRDSGPGPDPACDPDTLFALFHSAWSAADPKWQREESPCGFGLFAARYLLEPYGARIFLTREDNETLAILELPMS